MKAVISSTFDNQYLYYIPLTTWLWNKLNVDVICFMPYCEDVTLYKKVELVRGECAIRNSFYYFNAPKHKEATYAQCSRLYAACLDLPEYEVLITSDVDMGVFALPPHGEGFTIFGSDLVPLGQLPMCYISATVKDWRRAFKLQYGAVFLHKRAVAELNTKTYQECLDEILGKIECESFRGNYWGKDQETAYNMISRYNNIHKVQRAREGTQFATKRYDRDDSFILDRLHPDTIDFHMNRPGYEAQNFNTILTILKYHYSHDNFDWLVNYTQKYNELL